WGREAKLKPVFLYRLPKGCPADRQLVGVAMRFFFQAEDGIRDKLVTGVQTCALPICEPGGGGASLSPVVPAPPEPDRIPEPGFRSEERRVGKEWGVGGGTGK